MQSVKRFEGVALLSAADVERYLPMADCIESMTAAFAALASGGAVQPVRHVVRLPDGGGALYSMPGYLSDDGGALAVKMVTLFPGNAQRGLETHQGVIVLFDARDGRVLAMIEAASVTAIRTAAVSGLATKLLAQPDASVLALLGSGVQARSHLAAMLEVRPIREVRVWSRTAAHAESFARQARDRHTVDVNAVENPETAVRGAEIICTVTGSPVPVVSDEWVGDGAHINAVGASTPETREIDGATVRRARLVVDSREAATVEAGDLLLGLGDDALETIAAVPELGDIVTGRATVRRVAGDVTLFESLGLAIEDVAAARTVYERAVASGG